MAPRYRAPGHHGWRRRQAQAVGPGGWAGSRRPAHPPAGWWVVPLGGRTAPLGTTAVRSPVFDAVHQAEPAGAFVHALGLTAVEERTLVRAGQVVLARGVGVQDQRDQAAQRLGQRDEVVAPHLVRASPDLV